MLPSFEWSSALIAYFLSDYDQIERKSNGLLLRAIFYICLGTKNRYLSRSIYSRLTETTGNEFICELQIHISLMLI